MMTQSSTLIPDSTYAKLCAVQVAAEALFAQESEGCPAHVSVPLIADLGVALYGEDDPRVKALRPKRYSVFHGGGSAGITGKFYIECGARTIATCSTSDEANLVCDALNEKCETAPPVPKEVKFRVGDWFVIESDASSTYLVVEKTAYGAEAMQYANGKRLAGTFTLSRCPEYRHATPEEIARVRGK